MRNLEIPEWWSIWHDPRPCHNIVTVSNQHMGYCLMSNKTWHHPNFFNYIHTDTYHLWHSRSNINTTLQLHFRDIMNKQWFTAAAFITQTWLKWQIPQASGGLMIPLCLLLFMSAEGTPLSSSHGCLLASNEASLITGHSQLLCSYSAAGHGKWKRWSPLDARVYPAADGATHSPAWWCWWPLVCDKMTYVTWHSLLSVKLPSSDALFSTIATFSLQRLALSIFT